jgi:gamma-glutamyltranspeptidase/glutathione hydrolase
VTALRSCSLSNDIVAGEAAEDCLLSGGSAVAAVLSGFFAAAGAYSGVLLGPLSVIVAGVGLGARVFDGRLRQPGLGTKRPRGFLENEPIPQGAYVAAPGAVAAAAVALAYEGERGLGQCVRYGLQRAERAAAETRRALLNVVRGLGAQAFSDPAFVRPLLHVAGASEGGLLTAIDLNTVSTEIDLQATAVPFDESWFEAPWMPKLASDSGASGSFVDGNQCVVIAFDKRGVAAVASFLRAREGVAFDAMELVAPRCARPVLRGVARVAPGERLSCPVSAAIRIDGGRPTEIVASPGKLRLGAEDLANAELRLRRDPSTRTVIPERR